MFDLNEAIGRWRANLVRRETFCGSDIDELESHLREEIEQMAGSKLSQEEAFWVATHRLGNTGDLAGEFAKINSGTVWSYRVFWMAAGLLAYFMLSYFAGATSQACVWIAAFGGLGGYSLGLVSIAAKVLIVGGTLFLLYRATRQGVCGGRYGRLTRRRKWRIILFSGLVVLVLMLNAAQILIRAKTAQIMSAQDFGQMAILSAYASLIMSVILPIVLVVLVVRRRPSGLYQIEA